MNISTETSVNAKSKSIFDVNIERGINSGFILISDDKAKITYTAARDYTASFKNPEEKVRASYFVELILDKQYPKNKIDLEVSVPRRTPEDRADIIVYEDSELKKPYLVVECKKDGITDAEFKQAIEQTFGNANSLRAPYAIVVAGTTKTSFDVAGFKPSEREKNVIADIPVRYGKAPKYRFVKGDSVNDLKTVSREELIRALEKSHDTVWQGGKLAPTTAFDEVAKLLFCKLKDEKDTTKGETYKFQIGTHETAQEVYDRIDSIYQLAKREDAEVFKEDIRLDPKIVYNVVEHLQGIAFVKTDLDTKGVAFERFMEDFFRGKMGQFFTPREIIRFCVQMLNPTKNDLVLDPAAGSGGFLLNALDEVRRYAEERYESTEAWQHWHNFAQHNLYGVEINDQIARVCKMNMIIHDDGHTNVIATDSLRDFGEINSLHRGFQKDHFDIILTNPPFGAEIKSTEHNYLPTFDLGKGKKNQKTEILFIERCIDFVKPQTGKIGIVLPDGILTNSSLQYVRNHIIERSQILAVVSLPQFAFANFGAGVKSSLVFLRRKGENEKLENYSIFMAIAEHIGYTTTGKKDSLNDLDTIRDEYNKFLRSANSYKESGEKYFTINFKDIKAKRLDPYYNLPKFNETYKKIANIKNIRRLKEVVETLDYGLMPTQDYAESEKDGIPMIRVTNILLNGSIDMTDVKYIPFSTPRLNDKRVKENDILMVQCGSTTGKVALAPKEYENYTFGSFCFVIRGNLSIINQEYLFAVLMSDFIQEQIKHTWNIVTVRPNTSKPNVENLLLPVPSIKAQNKIAASFMNKLRESKELKLKSQEVFKNAKKEVEEMILLDN